MMTFRCACCTLAIHNMNGADSLGREEMHQRINERDREARMKEKPEEGEARLARRRATTSNICQGQYYANTCKISLLS